MLPLVKSFMVPMVHIKYFLGGMPPESSAQVTELWSGRYRSVWILVTSFLLFTIGDLDNGDKDKQFPVDSIDGLTLNQIGGIFSYIELYKKKYIHVGVLEGKYFDSSGIPQPIYHEFWAKVGQYRKLKDEEESNG